MEIISKAISVCFYGGKYIKGRGRYDTLELDEVGPLFVVGWEDSAHHYWHSQYFDNLEEAKQVYEDYFANGIPDECEED